MSSYRVRMSDRARAMRLEVHPDGSVIVTAPRTSGLAAIDRFVTRHRAWLSRAIERTHGRTVIRLKRSDIPRLKREARQIAERLCARYAATYGLTYGNISIRAQKTRWGSCSKAGNLSFNYKIAALPTDIAEYIIVHEVCHLAAFDHSPAFWSLVAREVRDHRQRRAQLRAISFMFS